MSDLQSAKLSGYRLGYRSDIEGLRAVAILLVIAAHARVPGFAGGFVGVDVFFVLSGYLITALLLAEARATGTIRFAEFYARRFRRLLPALALMLVGTLLLASVVLAPADQPRQTGAAASAAAWLSNLYFVFTNTNYFSPGAESNLFLHTWSLGVEEQFYLLWPALLFFVLKRAPASQSLDTRRLQLTMAVVFAASLLACLLVTRASPPVAFYLMPTRAWQFALGALAFLVATRLGDSAGRRWGGWVGLAAIGISARVLNEGVAYPGAWALLPSVGAGLVLLAGTDTPSAGIARLLSRQPLQAIGNVSYAWYLWHWPLLLLGAAIGGGVAMRLGLVALSLAMATASYHLLEKRITAKPRWIAQPRFAITAALAIMALVHVTAIRWGSAALSRLSEPQYARFERVRLELPAIYGMGCDDWFQSSDVKACAFGNADAKHVAVAMGDSVGLQWFPAIAAVFDRADWRLLVITKSSCPMVDETIFYARIGREYTECTDWRRGALEAVAGLRPDVVILGSSLAYDLTDRQWSEGTERVLEQIDKAVGHVYVLRPTPLLSFDGPACLAPQSRLQRLIAPRECSSPAYDARALQVGQALAEAVRRSANATLVDMNDVVCPAERCTAERRGTIVYRDSQHLTVQFTISLAEELADRIGMGGSG